MRFPKCDETPLGIYPIVDRANKLKPLYECGITTTQLRIKDLQGKELEDEIIEAIKLSREYNARFFLNDYWALAIKHKAYGVHLGQEDIQEADINAIYSAGLRLGISTHNPSEIDIAMKFEPSYLAIGPVYPPISKKLTYPPIGIDGLIDYSKLSNYPIVAIGGITQENISKVASANAASGIAMISAVLDANGNISKSKTKQLIEAVKPYGL